MKKLKWPNVLLAVVVLSYGSLTVLALNNDSEPPQQLIAGDLVEHKLLGWDGIVLWNQEGPRIAVRWKKAYSPSVIWEDSIEAEWVKQ